MPTPAEVRIGQKWSAWVPSRGQWLLTTVIRRQGPQVTLRFDPGYGIGCVEEDQKVDETAMMENRSLFRLIEPG
jgi:hypothetical protein